jgi:PadR family transcriptional regulator PadR
MSTNPLLKGSLQTIILKLLEDNDQMYGYEITQKVKEVSEGEIMLTEGPYTPLCTSWRQMAF